MDAIRLPSEAPRPARSTAASAAAPAHGSAAQRIEAELRRAIVAMELPPGARLSEQEIAERHGVSRQPVREALIGLARMRLVEIQPQRGTIVVKISMAKLMEARFVREAIETAVARRAAATAFEPAARERIAHLIELQQEVAAEGDHTAFQRYDEMFHSAIADGAGLPLAWQAVRDIKAHMDRACHLTLPGTQAMLPLVAQHRAIAAAIESGNPDAAAEAMRLHLGEILRAMPRLEAEHPEIFE